MPKRTATKGFPRHPDDCFASRHQSASEWKVYNVLVACAKSHRKSREGDNATGPLIFNASIVPWLCNAVPLSRNQAYDVMESLEKTEWIVLLKEGQRRQDRTKEPNTYRVVEHEEFVRLHPGSCPPNMYAPDFETAREHGVGYGDKLKSDGALPKNFRANTGALGRALDKITAEDFSIVTDDEQAALSKHMARFEDSSSPGLANSSSPGLAQSRATELSSTGIPTEQVPKDRHIRYRDSGKNLVTATGTELVTASTTPTPATPEPGMAESKATRTLLPSWVYQDWKTAATMSSVGEGMAKEPNLSNEQHRKRFVEEIFRAPGRSAAAKELRVEQCWFNFCHLNPKPYGPDKIFPVLVFLDMLPDMLRDKKGLDEAIYWRSYDRGSAYRDYPTYMSEDLAKAYKSWYDQMMRAHNEELEDLEPDPGTSHE